MADPSGKLCGCNRRLGRGRSRCVTCGRGIQTVPILDTAWTLEQYRAMHAARTPAAA